MLKKYKNIIIAVVVIALLFAGYNWLRGAGSSSGNDLLVGTAVGGQDSKLLSTLLQLRSIKLDPNLFESAAFKSLRDFSQELVPEPVGRPNPFAPL